MIIERQEDVTTKVLEAFSQTPDPRLREILTSLVKHLHGFAREVRLTEQEFEKAVGYVVALGQKTHASHNEAVALMKEFLEDQRNVWFKNKSAPGARHPQVPDEDEEDVE